MAGLWGHIGEHILDNIIGSGLNVTFEVNRSFCQCQYVNLCRNQIRIDKVSISDMSS
jgi:hypothetical protein